MSQVTRINIKKYIFKKPDLFGLIAAVVLFLLLTSYIFGAWKIVKAGSHSTIDGYYLVLFSSKLPIATNDYVAVCIPTKGYADFALAHKLPANSQYCYHNTTPLLKMIKATVGDLVVENSLGVQINGVAIPYSAPLIGSGLISYTANGERLKKDEFFVMGTNPRSFDSRYYGPVNRFNIIGKAYLIWKI